MTLAEIAAICLLAAWLVLSVLGQIRFGALYWVRAWDVFGIIPMWWFFAPNPARHDFYLLYRDQLKDGSRTEWTEVKIGTNRKWTNLIWNPGRRERKALFDVVTSLAREAATTGDITIQVSVPYLSLLNYVSRLPRTPASELTQFLLMQSEVETYKNPPTAVFMSNLHRVGGS